MSNREEAKELLNYLIIGERIGHIIQGNVAEIAKGELAVFTAGDPATNMVTGRGRSTNVMQVVEAK